MLGYSSPGPFRITLDAKFLARAFLEGVSKADSLQMNPHYDDNWISRRLEPLIAWWRGSSGGMPLWLGAIFLIFVVVWCWLFVEVVQELWHLTEGSSADEADGSAEREHIQAMVFAIGLLGALLTAPIVPYRLWLQNRQTVTSEQGHITDRLTRAIEQLGAEKTQRKTVFDESSVARIAEDTVPNLEVRLGAIYALERIAQDSERDHIPVMETLCAYIRQNAPASEAEDHHLGTWPSVWIGDPDNREERSEFYARLDERHEGLHAWLDALPLPRVDIQAAMSVIGRRSASQIALERQAEFKLDLRETDLRCVDLKDLNFDNTNFHRARLENALFTCTSMVKAYLHEARLEGVDAAQANFAHADLSSAYLEDASFIEAILD